MRILNESIKEPGAYVLLLYILTTNVYYIYMHHKQQHTVCVCFDYLCYYFWRMCVRAIEV